MVSESKRQATIRSCVAVKRLRPMVSNMLGSILVALTRQAAQSSLRLSILCIDGINMRKSAMLFCRASRLKGTPVSSGPRLGRADGLQGDGHYKN